MNEHISRQTNKHMNKQTNGYINVAVSVRPTAELMTCHTHLHTASAEEYVRISCPAVLSCVRGVLWHLQHEVPAPGVVSQKQVTRCCLLGCRERHAMHGNEQACNAACAPGPSVPARMHISLLQAPVCPTPCIPVMEERTQAAGIASLTGASARCATGQAGRGVAAPPAVPRGL